MGKEQSRADDQSASSPEGEQSSGLLQWLKIMAIVVPLVATLCGGIWAIWTWYSDFQLKQNQNRLAIEAEHTKQAEEHTKAEKLAQNSKELELTLQKLRTEEQQARERISRQEIAQREKELQLKTKSDEATRLARETQEVVAYTSMLRTADTQHAKEALASLIQYAKTPQHRDLIVIALTGKFKDIRTFEEAQLAIKLARAIEPADFDLIAGANRAAFQHVEKNYIAEFWHSYALHRDVRLTDFLLSRSTTYACMLSSAPSLISRLMQEVKPYKDQEMTSTQMTLILEKYPSPDMVLFEAHSFILKQSVDMLADFIEVHKGEPLKLDISGCCYRIPEISKVSRIQLFDGRKPINNPWSD